MDAPPPAQPDAAAPAAAAPSSTSDSAPSPAPPANPPTSSVAPVAPPASDSTTVSSTPTPSTGTTSNPAQTLDAPAPAPAPSPAVVRPPAPRMRPPYTHLASPITMSSASSPATSGASASSASVPASSASSAAPRGGVVIGVPAPRPAQTPVGYTGFVPPPPLSYQFGSAHRGPDQPPTSSAQFRQPSPGIQNIGMVGSLSATQMRPAGNIWSTAAKTGSSAINDATFIWQSDARFTTLQQPPQSASSVFRPQQRPQLPQPRPQPSAPVPLHQQNIISAQQQQLPQHQPLQQQQQLPQHQPLQQQQQQKQQQQSQQQSTSHQNQQNTALKTPQQAACTPVPMAQKPDTPATPNATVMQSINAATVDTDGSESGNRLLTKRSIHELVAQIDPNEKLDPEVEDVLIDIAEDFVESVATFACSLAKHRKSDTLEAKDVLLHAVWGFSNAERSWNITLPGFSGDEIKLYKKQHINDIHRERLYLIKKSMASDTKASAAQAAANQKNQTQKPPAPGSP
ncbi:hypothetical protein EJB05_18368, partial [Eragrostis curvula]